MPESPKRRWFQFRLRTLLIGVVLLSIPCAYVGHEVRTAVTRRSFLHGNWCMSCTPSEMPGDPPSVSMIRDWLGDTLYLSVKLRAPAPPEVVEQFKTAFPEADIVP